MAIFVCFRWFLPYIRMWVYIRTSLASSLVTYRQHINNLMLVADMRMQVIL